MNRRNTRIQASAFSVLLVALGLATTAGCKGSNKSDATPAITVAESGMVKITVSDQGFVPSSVQAKQGQPLTLEFTRITDKTCATQVAFPELNLTKDLPLNSAVSIQVPTDKARTLTFQCGMGMYKSSVVIS
jgi:plastocyanin domain-containing protein